jgi:hypothetical protein
LIGAEATPERLVRDTIEAADGRSAAALFGVEGNSILIKEAYQLASGMGIAL